MSRMNGYIFAAALLVGGSLYSVPAVHAAEGYANCNNFIDSLPASISTQGVWCLRKDLATNITSGSAIRIETNNVTIDCNDFKIGGLAAGTGTSAMGVYTAPGKRNATIRNCNVRGFSTGIYLSVGGSGHLVEDNRVDNSRMTGIQILGEGSRAQRNRVFDTGGPWTMFVVGGTYSSAAGMEVAGDVLDNVVTNVFSSSAADIVTTTGIRIVGDGYDVRRNRVRKLMARGAAGRAWGIDVNDGPHSRIDSNHIVADDGFTAPGAGIRGRMAWDVFCGRNTIASFTQATFNCTTFRPNVTN